MNVKLFRENLFEHFFLRLLPWKCRKIWLCNQQPIYDKRSLQSNLRLERVWICWYHEWV